jgi:hypothetical protein
MCLEACLILVMCLGAQVMSTNQWFVFTFNMVMQLKACFIFGEVFGSTFNFGDVLGSAFVIGDVYGLLTNRLPSLKHKLLVRC